MRTLFNRSVLLAAFSLLLLQAVKAQSLCWAQAINSSNIAHGAGIGSGATDAAGNLYSVGAFSGTVDFAQGAGVSNLTAVSNHDIFIMKEDASGNLIWVKQIKGLSSGVYGCFGSRVDIDDVGNVFVTGTFRDSFDFDPGLAVYTLNSYGAYHAFVLKLDPTGDFTWVKDIGTQVPAVGVSATAAGRDKNGDLYFAALLSGDDTTPIDVDPGPTVYNITPSRGDLLLEKLNANGDFIWAKLVTGDDIKTPRSLAFDDASNVFVSGDFYGSADFDPSPAVYTLTATPASLPSVTDFFVAKYDSAGNFSWAQSFGTNSSDRAWGGDVDRFGNVLIAGHFGGTVDFDPGPGVYNLTSASTRSIVTLKLRNNGDFVWARMAGGGGLNEGRAIAVDDTGNVYTAATLGGSYVTVQKLDSAGNDVWSAGLEGQAPGWIGLDNKDSVYITGAFSGFNRDFDPGPGVYTLSGVSASVSSGFIVKLNQTLLPSGVEETNFQTEAVSVYPNPSSGMITFSSPTAINRIEITDLTGKVAYQSAPKHTQTEINLSGKAKGVYFYEVDCGGKTQRGKLVLY